MKRTELVEMSKNIIYCFLFRPCYVCTSCIPFQLSVCSVYENRLLLLGSFSCLSHTQTQFTLFMFAEWAYRPFHFGCMFFEWGRSKKKIRGIRQKRNEKGTQREREPEKKKYRYEATNIHPWSEREMKYIYCVCIVGKREDTKRTQFRNRLQNVYAKSSCDFLSVCYL